MTIEYGKKWSYKESMLPTKEYTQHIQTEKFRNSLQQTRELCMPTKIYRYYIIMINVLKFIGRLKFEKYK